MTAKIFLRYGKLKVLAAYLEKIKKTMKLGRSAQTGRKLRAAVLRGPRNLRLEYIPEEVIQPTQVVNKICSFSVIAVNYLM